MINWLKSLFTPKPPLPTISVSELNAELRTDAPPVVIDVRSAQEFGFHGHIAEAKLIPLNEIQQRVAEIPSDRPLVLVCRTSRRSARAARFLLAQEISDVQVLDGGMLAWTKAGLPVERNPV